LSWVVKLARLGGGLGCFELGHADLDIEFVAFGVGHQHPAVLWAPVGDDPGAEPDKPGDLVVLALLTALSPGGSLVRRRVHWQAVPRHLGRQ
jgi:hypothetical protein